MRTAGRPSIFAGGISLALAAVLSSAYAIEASAQSEPAFSYDSIAVVKPASDATVFDSAGNVEVRVAVSPALRAGAGDRVALFLDGRQVFLRSATRFKLSGIVRGEHTVKAQVVDGSGNALISSNPVKFHLWQASRLFPNRRGS